MLERSVRLLLLRVPGKEMSRRSSVLPSYSSEAGMLYMVSISLRQGSSEGIASAPPLRAANLLCCRGRKTLHDRQDINPLVVVLCNPSGPGFLFINPGINLLGAMMQGHRLPVIVENRRA